MGGLPSGVVSFVFTDVVGSVRLWSDAPNDMMEALERHDLIIDEVVASHNGHSVKPRGEGDSRFLVFADPADAVAAISEVQVRFFNTQWPTSQRLTVRAAVHTGDAGFRSDDYYGPEVNRTARLRDMAEGGQTVMSKTTHDLVINSLPEGVTATDLGEHRLRDIAEPERIYQLNPPGLPSDFDFEAPLLEVRLLGPLEVVSRGVPREITSAKQRAMLTLLAINAGQPLSWERIVDAVWGEDAPASGKKTVAYHMSQLRDTLDPDRHRQAETAVRNREGGYVLDVPLEDIDLFQFEALIGSARDQHRTDARAGIAAQALALWRGDPFPGMRYDDFTQRESARLHELKLEAHELLAGARLEMGDVAGGLNEIAPLVDDHPYRESLAVLHARALYRANRQADALAVIERTRRTLLDDLGLSIGSELADLENDILNQSPGLRKLPDEVPVRGFLPEPVDRFVGRETELARIQDLFEQNRLVTLVGLGGIGKSRLALQAALHMRQEYPGGVWLVELARVRRGRQVLNAVAETLDLDDVDEDGVVEAAVEMIGEDKALLILDNCEHVLANIKGFIAEVGDMCPNLRLLSTSRMALGLPGERTLPVGPLGVQVGASAATDLFRERAAAVSEDSQLDPTLVAEVCRRIGGIPLAIELAASWLRLLSLRELNEELKLRLDLLSSTSEAVPDRQSALVSVIDWSIEAAGTGAADLLEGLSVFRGGFTLDAAMAVGGSNDRLSTLQMIDHLVSQSLVTRDTAAARDSRFRLLEPVREHVGTRLREHGRYKRAVVDHRDFFRQLVADAYDELTGDDQQEWMRRLDLEVDNIRSALDRASDDPDQALPIAARFWRYWLYRGRAHEGISSLAPLIDVSREPSTDRLLGLYGYGVLASNLGLLDDAVRSLNACLAEAGEAGEAGLAALANMALSGATYLGGDAVRAAMLLEDAIESFRQAGDLTSECLTACKLSYILGQIGRGAEGDSLLSQAVEKCSHVPSYIEAELLLARGLAAVANGELDLAEELNNAADAIGKDGGFVDQRAWAKFGLGDVALSRGDSRAAQKAYSAAIRTFDQIGEIEGIVLARSHLGVALAMSGQIARAEEVLEYSLSSATMKSPAEVAFVYEAMAFVSSTAGKPAEVARNIGAAASTRVRTGTITRPPLLAFVRSAELSARSALGDERFADLASSGVGP